VAVTDIPAGAEASPDPLSRVADDRYAGTHFRQDDRSCTYNGLSADPHAWKHGCIGPDPCCFPERGPTSQDRTGGNVRAATDTGIMLYYRTRVDDSSPTDFGGRVDDRSCQDDSSGMEPRAGGESCGWVHDRGQLLVAEHTAPSETDRVLSYPEHDDSLPALGDPSFNRIFMEEDHATRRVRDASDPRVIRIRIADKPIAHPNRSFRDDTPVTARTPYNDFSHASR
jgi:hypothetical protein